MSDAFKCDGPCSGLHEGKPELVYEKSGGMVSTSFPANDIELCKTCATELAEYLEGDL